MNRSNTICQLSDVEFRVIDKNLEGPVIDFMWQHYFPDEPLHRSLGAKQTWLTNYLFVQSVTREGGSIAALDKTGRVLGVRIAKVLDCNHWMPWLATKVFRVCMRLLGPLCFSRWNHTALSLLFKKLDYDIYNICRKYNCTRVYEAKALCSARFHGIKGLGSELVRQGERLARSQGCTHGYVMVTGNYSAKVFSMLGYKLEHGIRYSDFRDESGNLYITDAREHDRCITVSKKFS